MGIRSAILLLTLGGDAEQAIRAWTKEPLVHVDARDVRDVPGLVVARCDTQEGWWGFFGCYGLKDGAVAWQATVDEEPTEQSIFSVRGWKSDIVGAPLIQVIGRTHMGNGSLYVYELRDRALRTVLRTRAYDGNCHEGLEFKGRCLDVEAREPRPGVLEIELRGAIQRVEDVGAAPGETWPCRKIFTWDARRRIFVEDVGRRLGFGPDERTWPPK